VSKNLIYNGYIIIIIIIRRRRRRRRIEKGRKKLFS
jgi:hypothetical protein